jgi:hypothetical protein
VQQPDKTNDPTVSFLLRIITRNKTRFMLTAILCVILLLICLLALIGVKLHFFGWGHVHSDIYYVSKTGSNSNPGSKASPWLTIQNAISKVSSGSTIYVHSGIYNEALNLTGKDGINLSVYPGDKVTIDGTGLSVTSLLRLQNSDNSVIDGFEIANATASYAIGGSSDIHNLQLRNLTIHNIYKGAIYFSGEFDDNGIACPAGSVTNLLIDHCEIYETNQILDSNEQVSLVKVNGFEVSYSVFHDSHKNGMDFKHGTSNGLVHDCEFYGTGYVYGDGSSGTSWEGIYMDPRDVPISNIQIYDCVFHDMPNGISLGSEEDPHPGIYNVDIYNNIFYNLQFGFRVMPHHFIRNYRLINNSFYHCYNTITSHDDTDSVNQSCVIRNNVLYGDNPADYLIYIGSYLVAGLPTIDHNIYYNSSGVYTAHLSDLIGPFTPMNPLYTNPGNLDFTLQGDSPAINAGSSLQAPTLDIQGKTRISPLDIGANEYNPSSPVIYSEVTGRIITMATCFGLSTFLIWLSLVILARRKRQAWGKEDTSKDRTAYLLG